MATAEATVAELGVFRGLGEPQLRALAELADERSFAPGELVLREGDPAVEFHVIRGGCVALETHVPQRGAVIVQTLEPGDVVGASWLLPPYRTHFDVRAIGFVRTVAFDAPRLRARLEQDPELGFELMRRFTPMVVQRLQATRLRLLDLYDGLPQRG